MLRQGWAAYIRAFQASFKSSLTVARAGGAWFWALMSLALPAMSVAAVEGAISRKAAVAPALGVAALLIAAGLGCAVILVLHDRYFEKRG